MENHLEWKSLLRLLVVILAAYLRLEVIGLHGKKNIFQLDSDWEEKKLCLHCKFNTMGTPKTTPVHPMNVLLFLP